MSRAELIANVMKAFEASYEIFQRDGSLQGLAERYNSLLVNRNREVRVLAPGAEFQGISKGINDTGELLVEKDDGTISKVYAGEVSVRGIYGYV